MVPLQESSSTVEVGVTILVHYLQKVCFKIENLDYELLTLYFGFCIVIIYYKICVYTNICVDI